MKDIPLKDIMVTGVITARVEDSLSEVESKFRVNGIRHVPVVDDRNHLLGIFTRNDLARCLAPHRTEDGSYYYDEDEMNRFVLRFVMTKHPLTLGPEDTLKQAVEIMASEKYGCIPIVKADGTLVGILTPIDVLKYISRQFEEN